jgi:MHS family proline/betaine transporter-like MFS transporter
MYDRPVRLRQHGAAARLIAGVSLGNALEYFDLALYTFFAATIGRLVFPNQGEGMQIMLSLGIYGVGYCARPLGGIIIGSYGDRYGRKAAINLTLMLMAAGTAAIGLTPTYQQAGAFAPLIVIGGRLLQAFSAGGETGASTTLLVESAPEGAKGFFASWQFASQGIAVVFGGGIAWALSTLLPPDVMTTWGWRIPFLLGVAIVPVGLYLRRTVAETLDVEAEQREPQNPAARLVTRHWSSAVIAVLALLGLNSAYVTLNLYMPTYGTRELGLSQAVSSAAVMIGGLAILVSAPVGGLLADRFGARRCVALSRITVIALAWPAFYLITTVRTGACLLTTVAILSIAQGLGSGFYLAMAQNFQKDMRVTGFAISYSIGTVITGGFGQLIVTWLIETSGNNLAPAFYIMFVGAISLCGGVMLLKDRHHA